MKTTGMLLVLSIALWAAPAQAKPRQETFKRSAKAVFAAVVVVVKDNDVLKHLDRESMTVTFETDHTWTLPVAECSASVSAKGDESSEVSITVITKDADMFGSARRGIAKKFFKQVQAELAKQKKAKNAKKSTPQ